MSRRYYAVYRVGHKHRHAIGCGDAYCCVVKRCDKCVHALERVVVDGQAVNGDAVDRVGLSRDDEPFRLYANGIA